jgi:hypothetical protein
MEKKLWYAIEKDEHDQNCTIIAVIEDGDDPICVDEIRDF